VVSTPWVVWTLVAINLSSAVIGYLYWYGDVLLGAPWWAWPFVPDSPLSASLWAAALLALYYGRTWSFLVLLAITGSMKYGLWTPWFWFVNYLTRGEFHLEAAVMTLSHLGMVLQGLLLVPLLAFRLRDVVLVGAWYGFNDLHDYLLGQRPRIPNPESFALIRGFAVASTVVLVLAWLVLALRRRREPRADPRGQRAAGSA
jgi:uncharacterized membrane protein YpjA